MPKTDRINRYEYDTAEGIASRAKTDWSQPQSVSDVTLAFPGSIYHLMPLYDAIPDEFKDMNGKNRWVQFQSDWFYGGLSDDSEFTMKDGIDGETAFRHLKAIQGSFEPKHEHKMAAVAYLASLWFKDMKYRRAKP